MTTKTFEVARDAVTPTLSLDALLLQNGHVHVTWETSDTGSGIASCTLEMREEGVKTWTTNECEGTHTHDDTTLGYRYTFHFTATDNVSNTASVEVEAAPPRVTKYFYHGGRRVALRVDNGGSSDVYYLHGDHLGSTSLTTCGSEGGCGETAYEAVTNK